MSSTPEPHASIHHSAKPSPASVKPLFWFLAILLLAEIICGAGMFLTLRQHLFAIADDALEGRAGDMERFLEARKDLTSDQLKADLIEKYKIEQSQDYVQVSDAAGNVVYRSRFFETHPLPVIAVDDVDQPLYRNQKLGDQRFRLVSEQVELNGRIYVVRIAVPMEEESETLAAFRRYIFLLAPILLFGAAIVGYEMSRRTRVSDGLPIATQSNS